eukprot:Rmarinus@m.23265
MDVCVACVLVMLMNAVMTTVVGGTSVLCVTVVGTAVVGVLSAGMVRTKMTSGGGIDGLSSENKLRMLRLLDEVEASHLLSELQMNWLRNALLERYNVPLAFGYVEANLEMYCRAMDAMMMLGGKDMGWMMHKLQRKWLKQWGMPGKETKRYIGEMMRYLK